ncbi:MAG: NAD-dependent epimerase/dehydratase family protein [Thermoleophilaceae bacterium]
MNVLVTGAQGFVGSWLAERLLSGGRGVVALRRDVDPASRFRTEGIEERCTLALADLTDHDALVRVLNEHEVSDVFHLGAQTIVGNANRSPLGTWEANVRGTYTLLEACRSLGSVRRVVVASSDKAYGEQDELPYREDLALRPRYPYDVSKACADLIARSYAHTFDLRVAVTRLANVYGPGDINWSRIVPDTARALARGERPVVRSDGTPERDYLYVEDAVNAYLAVGASLDRPELSGRAWNAGWGRGVPVLEVVRTLVAASGRPLEPDVRGQGTPHAEIDRQYLDSSAIRSELGWEPKWELERGLAASWEWYERHLSG